MPQLVSLAPALRDRRAEALAGLAAGAAFVAVLEVDLRLTGNEVDDLVLLGRPFVRDRKRARLAGLAIHAMTSVVLAGVFASAAERMSGPFWLRGVIYANAENLALYPLLILEDHHPAVRGGELDHYWTWPSFLQSIPRHVAYGAVLGAVYGRLHRG